MVKIRSVALAGVLLVAMGCSAAPAIPGAAGGGGPVSVAAGCTVGKEIHPFTPPLHVCGTAIVDAHNRRTRLLSLSFVHLGVGDGTEGTTADGCPGWQPIPSFAASDVKSWGFNSVRVNVSWANLQPKGPQSYNQAYLKALDDALASFRAAGVPVILQMYQARWSPAFKGLPLSDGSIQCEGWGLPAWLYPKGGGQAELVKAEKAFFSSKKLQLQFAGAWKFLLRRYKSDSNIVALDIMNEPYDLLTGPYPPALVKGLRPADLNLAAFYERVAKQIRAVNTRAVLIFEDHFSRRLDTWSVNRKPQLSDAVMADHFYALNWAKGAPTMKQSVQRAATFHVPLWIGEFTAFNRTIGDPYPQWQASLRKLMAFCKKNGVGWAVWLYGAGAFEEQDDIHTPKAGLLPILRGGF
ncbi:MAG: glycoside hydrolase family 5 protein [Actinomycetota bacterium]|nr:glycoside hydrolase family 5 protein [Actinomycetota bacterium]